MSTLKQKLYDASLYVTFPAGISVMSVEALRHLQKAVNYTDILVKPVDLFNAPMNSSALAATMGVAVGNVIRENHNKAYALFVLPAAAGGAVAGYAAEKYLPGSMHIAAFSAATLGMSLRLHKRLPEEIHPSNDLN